MKWASFIMSLVALVVSGMTFYFNYMYEKSHLDLYVYDLIVNRSLMDNDSFYVDMDNVCVDMAFTNNGNKQILLKNVSFYFGNEKIGKLYPFKISIPPLPMEISSNKIANLRVISTYKIKRLRDIIGREYEEGLPAIKYIEGKLMVIPLGIQVEAMDYRGNSIIKNIDIRNITFTDSGISIENSWKDNVIKIRIY